MIFVTVGTQPQKFDRLLKEIKKLEKNFSFIVQVGSSNIEYEYADTFDYSANIDEFIQNAELVITHGGVGTIMKCLELNKKFLVVPRYEDEGEHVNDHQLEISEYVLDHDYAGVVTNINNLHEQIHYELYDAKRQSFDSNNKNFNDQLLKLIKEME